MADLIAQGPQPDDRWRRHLDPGVRLRLGRQSGAWSAGWDNLISREHIEISYEDGQLHVATLPNAANAVFYRGRAERSFMLRPGEHFVIGKTTFSLVDPRVASPQDLPGPTEQRMFATLELHHQPFREPDKRIEALSRLPDIIHRSASDQELFPRLANLLFAGIERATAAAVVALEQDASNNTSSAVSPSASDEPEVRVLHWERHLLSAGDFRPSRRLIRQAVISGQSVAYVWRPEGRGTTIDFTLSDQTEWAICAPIASPACPGWALYVAGGFDSEFAASRSSDPELLQDDVKYTEIMASTLGGLLQARQLAARQASLSQFFSPIVLAAIGQDDPEQVLAPREADVTVLFCDLRGFTSESERLSHDLFGLLSRVSEALGVMTRQILEEGGVIGDFHGDAAMGFWGWPIAQADPVLCACRAALGIRANFQHADACGNQNEPGAVQPTSTFRVGIGIATGRAVAGKIGTADQVKVTAFGPVVNLASRLETMTRQLPASILIDSPTADALRAALAPDICRIRRLARVRPVGLSAPIDVYEILPPASECPELADGALAHYEAALTFFQSGDWRQAKQLLRRLPRVDRAKDLLLGFIADHNNAPPPNWDGAIHLTSK